LPNRPLKFDKYEVIRRLGRGGMGAVYLARDPDLDCLVAIKVLRDADEELLERFLREARAAASLHHENLITVNYFGQHEHQPFMVMEYVDGKSFKEIIEARQPLTLAEKLFYMEQVCAGLYHAHSAGIVHRDIKPANLMVDRHGTVRIVDFGIARVEGSGMTVDGAMIGTLDYMSPEQLLGLPVDYRSDIFAVGAVAYELLSYQRVFSRTLNDTLLPRLSQEHPDPVPLAELCSNMPAGLESIVMRALAKRPEDRFANLEEARVVIREVRRAVNPQLELEPVVTRVIGRAPSTKDSSSSARKELLERRELQIATHKHAARAAFAAQDLDGAIAASEDVLTLDPNDRQALQLLGEIQRAKQQRDQESRERHDRERIARQQVVDAELKLSQGDIAGTRALIQQALAVDPDNPSALALLSRLESGETTPTPVAATVLRREAGIESSSVNTRLIPHGQKVPTGVTSRRRIVIVTSMVACTAAAILAVSVWLAPGRTSPETSPPSATGAIPRPSAPAVVTPETVAAETAPTALSAADRLLQERLDRITAAYDQGNLAGALRLVDPVLATTDDDRARELARSIAQSAIRGMISAENAAVSQKVQELSPRTFAAAIQLRTRADQAMAGSDFVEAGTQALAATTLYERAKSQAGTAVVATNRPAPPPEPVTTPAPGIVTAAPTVPAAPSIPAAVPAASPATAPPTNSPAPVTAVVTAPASVEDRERAGIQKTLDGYVKAYRDRSVKLLLEVYPSLPRETRQVLERTFTRDCRAYDATLLNQQLAMNAQDPTFATVTARTTYTCQPKTAQPPQLQSMQEVFVLRKLGNGWTIQSTATMDTTPRR